MSEKPVHMITGAGGFSGKYIAQKLISTGVQTNTLTSRRKVRVCGRPIKTFPYNFQDPTVLEESLHGVEVLYNTYWIRFPRKKVTYEAAINNTQTLVDAAKRAGVQKIVHISITNPALESPLSYFRSKALVESLIVDSGLSYAIVRPAVIFGPEDILINNIAWMLRKFPLFGIIGSGEYGVRPIFVEDLAELMIDAARERRNLIIDAVGPETFTFEELVRLIAERIGAERRIVHVPKWSGRLFAKAIGLMVRDVVLTKDEIRGLLDNLLVTEGPATGKTRLSDYLEKHCDRIGVRYTSELGRHYRQKRQGQEGEVI